MLRVIIVPCVAAILIFGALQIAGASDLCCIGKTEKDVRGVCVVTGFQEGRICMEEIADGKSKACWGISGCYELKDLGNAGKGSHVIVTGWRAGDNKCYTGPNCGTVIVRGGGVSRQSSTAPSLPLPPGSQPPAQDNASLPPPPLPEGVQGQQQSAPTASLPPPPQQPQQVPQPATQQEPQQPATQTIDNTLNIFKKARDLFK